MANNNSLKNREYILLALVLVVYGVIALAVPFNRNDIYWFGFAFGIIAIAFQVFVLKTAFAEDGSAKSFFYGFPIARLGILYMVVQVVVSFAEMALSAVIPMWVVLIVNIVLLAAAIAACLLADTMKEEIKRQDATLKVDVNNMRNLQSLSTVIVSQNQDDALKGYLTKLVEEFKYSDPVSSIHTLAIESEMTSMMAELQRAVLDGDSESAKIYCGKIANVLAERNRICALNK